MTGGTDIVTAAITAAQADDIDTLGRLVDWPLTGAAQLAAGLADVSARDRAAAAGSGLAELNAAQQDAAMVEDILRPLAAILAAAREVRAATPAESAATLSALRLPPVPADGLTGDQLAELDRLRDRTAALAEVYLVSGAAGQVSLVRAPDTDRLALILDEL